MSARLIIIVLAIISPTVCGLCALTNSFIFIEQRPPFTSEDKTAKSIIVYANERGLVQQYACEDYQIKELQEVALPVAGLFQALSGISLQSLPRAPEADAMLPPSQAHPAHVRIMVRQPGGAECLWAGKTNAIPSALQKLVQEAGALAAKLPPPESSSGDFVRADVLSADQLAEYRVSPPAGGLRTVKVFDDLDPVLKQSLTNPFRLIPTPAGTNPLSAFTVKGEASPLPLLYNGTGYEVIRYSVIPPSRP